MKNFRSGFVGIIGEPNVGKSTLLNAIMGEKLAIVTPKPQTTRNQIRAILSDDDHQIIFLDTPGILDPKYQLHSWMIKNAYAAIEDADLALYMIDATKPPSEIENDILAKVAQINRKTILVINKIDRIGKDNLLPIIDRYQQKFSFSEIVPISAVNGDGVDLLFQLILEHTPEGPKFYPDDQISDLPQRFFVGEAIREKIFLETSQEMPYSTGVVVEQFKERDDRKTFISAIIYVERQSQRGIMIGKRGSKIKQIGQLARTEIEEFLDQPVYLELHVLVKENWRRDKKKMEDLGYV